MLVSKCRCLVVEGFEAFNFIFLPLHTGLLYRCPPYTTEPLCLPLTAEKKIESGKAEKIRADQAFQEPFYTILQEQTIQDVKAYL